MIEYTLDSLVHLYDSLNSELDKNNYEIEKLHSFGCDCNLTLEARAEYKEAENSLYSRNKKLINMREATERLIHILLNEELKGA